MKSASIVRLSSLAALALPVLLAGCQPQGGVVTCPRAAQILMVGVSGTPLKQLDVSGDACGAPSCVRSDPTNGCTSYIVGLLQAGNCILVATAVDGRQSLVTVNVTSQGGGPCGPSLSVDNPVMFSFPAVQDAAAPDTGGGSDAGAPDTSGGGDIATPAADGGSDLSQD
jgi:hypothetical protein